MKFFNLLCVESINRNAQLARYWSNQELRRFSQVAGGDVVNVSGWKDEDKQGRHYRDYFPKARSYTIANYEGDSGYQGAAGEILLDLRAPLREELKAGFDTVLSHTALEHIFEVHQAFANLAAMTRDLLFVVVPFCQNQHELGSFGDYWRFTPSSLRELYSRNGLQVIYESCNENFGCANYLFFAGSRCPEHYAEFVQRHVKLPLIGEWIGKTWWQKIIPRLWVEKL
jgi:hypothetical protein